MRYFGIDIENMDASFEIMVPKRTHFTHFNFEVPYFQLDGVNYAQGPPECAFGDVFTMKFEDIFHMRHAYKELPDQLRKIEWQAIWVEGDGFDRFIGSLFGVAHEYPGYTLNDLLRALLGDIDAWIVIYGPQCDGFSYSKAGNLEDIIPELEDSLKHTRQGFMLYHG